MGFLGYPRPDGSVGVRNHVAILSSVSYSNGVVAKVAREVKGTKGLTHTEGCGREPEDLELIARTLAGLGSNPNVAAVVVVGLGSEAIGAREIARRIAESGKPVEVVVIQEEGGSRKATEKACSVARRLVEYASTIERREFGWEKLTLGVECGGSDALSGITANPAIGECADWLVGQGGAVVLTEVTEMIGTEKILGRRAGSPEVAKKLDDVIGAQMRLAASVLGPLASGATISPGNVKGGITSIQEKSLGCIIKGGTTTIRDVIPFAGKLEQRGLHIMDGPGSDIFSVTGVAATGAQVIIFSTGRGSPMGFPIVPVVKVSTNTDIWQRLNDDIDLDAGRIIEGTPVAEVGRELVELVTRVAEGEQTKAEANSYDLLSVYATGPAVARTTAS
jgi:altronate dehydratase large subunit